MSSTGNPLVSFVVLCYNHERFIGDCLESILGQEGEYDFEIILVDDFSLDQSQAVARSYSDPRIRVISHSRNLGHIATVHDGLAKARGEFIARIDGDDRYRPYYLKKALDIFERYPEVGLVYGDAAIIDDEGEISLVSCDVAHNSKDFKGNEFVQLLEKNFICAPTVIARREAWLKTLPVPAGLAFHDWYFTLMISREWEFYYLNHVLADYRVHHGNLHSLNIQNKVEEPSIFRLLGRIFSEPEKDKGLENKKQRAKRRIYAAHYLDMANKYFGYGYDADARRCYLKVLRYRPAFIFDPGVMRRLFGAIIGRNLYEASKSGVKAFLSRA